MSKFELSIYGENDELIKKYETNHVRWGVFLQAIKLKEEIKERPIDEQINAIGSFVKSIFPGITDEEIEKADGLDVINTFNQLVSAVGGISGGNSKNA